MDIDGELLSSLILENSLRTSIKAGTPEDLNVILNKFTYGYVYNGKVISTDDFSKYKTETPATFNKYKAGICWDFVAFEYAYFKKYFKDLKVTTYFIQLDNKKDNPTHTWLCFENKRRKGYVYLFESSWSTYAGVIEYVSEKSMLESYIDKFLDFAKVSNKSKAKYIIFKFKQPSKYELTPIEYMTYIYNTGKVITSNRVDLSEVKKEETIMSDIDRDLLSNLLEEKSLEKAAGNDVANNSDIMSSDSDGQSFSSHFLGINGEEDKMISQDADEKDKSTIDSTKAENEMFEYFASK